MPKYRVAVTYADEDIIVEASSPQQAADMADDEADAYRHDVIRMRVYDGDGKLVFTEGSLRIE